MNRVHHLLLAVIILCSCFGIQTIAQTPSASPSQQTTKKEQDNPFAPEPAGPLPAGMTGADVNDARAKLMPGFFVIRMFLQRKLFFRTQIIFGLCLKMVAPL